MYKNSDRVAIVTGAASGIGAAVAKRLASAGNRVVVNFHQQSADETVREIEASGGKCFAVQADVTDEKSIVDLFARAEQVFGPVSTLVNNAGFTEIRTLEESDPEYVDRLMRLLVTGPLLGTKEFVRRFCGGSGRVVNISSGAARYPLKGQAVYSAAKSALEALTRGHALELALSGITVNAVAPGFVTTRVIAQIPPEVQHLMRAVSMQQRLGQPEDVASLVSFICSEESDWITGEVYNINGGPRFPGL